MNQMKNALVAVRWLPTVQPVRFTRRVNIQRPRPPHYDKAKLIDVCKPVFARQTVVAPMFELCQKASQAHQADTLSLDNPYFKFLARDFMENVNKSRMIAFLHSNSVTAHERFKVGVSLKRQGMAMKVYNRNIVRLAVENTGYRAILPLFESHTAIVFSPHTQVKKLLRILKKAPQFVLLAGIVDGQQLSRTELVKYSQLPDLVATRAGLVGVINTLGGHLVSSLCAHQQALVRHLDQHVELLQQQQQEQEPATLTDKQD